VIVHGVLPCEECLQQAGQIGGAEINVWSIKQIGGRRLVKIDQLEPVSIYSWASAQAATVVAGLRESAME
jgi:hypothetical protein